MINGEINEEATNSVEQDVDLSQENGDTQTDTDITTLKKSELKKRKKSKSKQKDKQLLKKEARMLREKAMSEGFESFSFSSFALSNETNKDESLQNGDSQTTVASRNTSQKRILKRNLDSNKSKRRKNMEID